MKYPVTVHKEFSQESDSERILKIGVHLPKLMIKSQAYCFFWDTAHSAIQSTN